jgi:hypothetical protein
MAFAIPRSAEASEEVGGVALEASLMGPETAAQLVRVDE